MIEILAVFFVFSYGAVYCFRENKKLNTPKVKVKVPKTLVQEAMLGMAAQLEKAMHSPDPLAGLVDNSKETEDAFNPTQVYIHRIEELEKVIIYDPKMQMAQDENYKWPVNKAMMKKNYIYIGEF
jgi:hypothetical protein